MALRLYITLIIVILLLAIAFIFGSQNEQTLTLNYLIARSEISVAQAVSIFTSLGFILGILVTLCWRFFRLIKAKRKRANPKVINKVPS